MEIIKQFELLEERKRREDLTREERELFKNDSLDEFKQATKDALEVWRRAGSAGQLLCDETSVALVFDRLEVRYDDENGLRVLALENGEEIDLRDYARVLRIDFPQADFPRVHVVFQPPRELVVRHRQAREKARGPSVQERIEAFKAGAAPCKEGT